MPIINTNYGGVPSLTNPALPEEVTLGKEYIDGDGEKQTGTYKNNEIGIVEGSITGSYEHRGITQIKAYAFSNCPDLKSASLPNALSLGNSCFVNCTSLETVNLQKATVFGKEDFYNCPNIKKMYLNKAFDATNLFGTNSSINFDLFSEGTIEEWLTMGKHSTGSGTYNLYMNNVLQDNIVAEGDLTILQAAMARCNFSSITFTGNVIRIGTSSFFDCVNCLLYKFSGNTEVPMLVNNQVFGTLNANAKIVVPDALYDSWITATNWSAANIVSHIVKASDYTD